ncbi:MAG: dehydrogenase subunit [Jatrophihabitans sp.]|jgi:NADH-quinone oxidoreductase subunit J|nr:dehydrogenase subunit [Jatrophihabitans sp.]MCW2656537.1 dehydrogenase subunit [Jatrophihabitans sp.]MDT4903301.1 NADH-quinone oxidoreductase subunit [Pseudonocardiales bacterium]MDT4927363.1 NADH-quinone oxidoreductase subunit [Pseudonocardiales bacterium]
MSAVLAAGPLVNGQVPLGEAIAFWILGPISLAGAIGMVLLRNAIHSALSLVATMMCLGAFYIIEQGPFLGLVQIIVYTGAIMILFLFVLMLVGRDASDSIVETLRGQRWAAALFGIGFALMVALGVGRAFTGERPVNLDKPNVDGGNVTSVAELLFTKYLFAFELTSALLIVAAVGAMVLAHIEREGRKPTQKSLARERIRSGRPQPLPGPGVLSTGNSIGTAALLPDGTISQESVMAGLQEFPPDTGNPRALDPADYGDSEVRQ